MLSYRKTRGSVGDGLGCLHELINAGGKTYFVFT